MEVFIAIGESMEGAMDQAKAAIKGIKLPVSVHPPASFTAPSSGRGPRWELRLTG